MAHTQSLGHRASRSRFVFKTRRVLVNFAVFVACTKRPCLRKHEFGEFQYRISFYHLQTLPLSATLANNPRTQACPSLHCNVGRSGSIHMSSQRGDERSCNTDGMWAVAVCRPKMRLLQPLHRQGVASSIVGFGPSRASVLSGYIRASAMAPFPFLSCPLGITSLPFWNRTAIPHSQRAFSCRTPLTPDNPRARILGEGQGCAAGALGLI